MICSSPNLRWPQASPPFSINQIWKYSTFITFNFWNPPCIHERHFKTPEESAQQSSSNAPHLVEEPTVFVDHLHNPDDHSPDEDGHAEYCFGVVPGHLVNRAVETRIWVGICDVEHFSCPSHLPSDALPHTESKQKKASYLKNNKASDSMQTASSG